INNNHQRKKIKFLRDENKVFVAPQVGSNCLLHRSVTNLYSRLYDLIFLDFCRQHVSRERSANTLEIWDTAGQERFKSLRTPFYRGSDMCLLTFAVDDPTSFKNLITWRKEFVYYADVKADFPFLVVGNKVDLERKVTLEETETWCKENGELPYVETSAKDSTNVEEAFMMCLRKWANNDVTQERIPMPDTVNLDGNKASSLTGCSCT
ncbi:unnamed protein product, partial [Meganyctiphanes norvegica]